MKIRHERSVAATPEQIFEALADTDSWGEWMHGLLGIEFLEEGKGEFGVGTKFLESRKLMGMKATEHFEVTAWDPPKTMKMVVDGSKGSSGKGFFYYTFSVEPEGEGSHVSQEMEIDQKMGCIASLFAGMMKKMMDKMMAKDFHAMCKYIETRAGNAEESSDADAS